MENINEVEEEGMDMDLEQDEGSNVGRKVYLPGQPLNEGEELVFDSSAYVMLHDGHAGTVIFSLGPEWATFCTS